MFDGKFFLLIVPSENTSGWLPSNSGSSSAHTTDKRGDPDSCEWNYTAFVFFTTFFSFNALELWQNGYVTLTQLIVFLVDHVVKYSVSI